MDWWAAQIATWIAANVSARVIVAAIISVCRPMLAVMVTGLTVRPLLTSRVAQKSCRDAIQLASCATPSSLPQSLPALPPGPAPPASNPSAFTRLVVCGVLALALAGRRTALVAGAPWCRVQPAAFCCWPPSITGRVRLVGVVRSQEFFGEANTFLYLIVTMFVGPVVITLMQLIVQVL